MGDPPLATIGNRHAPNRPREPAVGLVWPHGCGGGRPRPGGRGSPGSRGGCCRGRAGGGGRPRRPGGRGWKRIGGVNRPRLDTFLAGYRAGVLDDIVRDDEPFRASEGAIDAYAQAWALTAFLAQTRKGALVEYINAIGAKPPLAPDSPEERLRDFVAAFGVEPHELEQPLMKFLARWKE